LLCAIFHGSLLLVDLIFFLLLLFLNADGVVNVHDLGTFALKMCLQKSRGANLFAIDPPNEQSQKYRMCISCKKKLLLYEWQMGEFIETRVSNFFLS
jgi:hypothetical protein